MKWVLRIFIPILLLIALVALVWMLLRPAPITGWCCLLAGTPCEGVAAYQECAENGGKVYHAEHETCDTLCSLIPSE